MTHKGLVLTEAGMAVVKAIEVAALAERHRCMKIVERQLSIALNHEYPDLVRLCEDILAEIKQSEQPNAHP